MSTCNICYEEAKDLMAPCSLCFNMKICIVCFQKLQQCKIYRNKCVLCRNILRKDLQQTTERQFFIIKICMWVLVLLFYFCLIFFIYSCVRPNDAYIYKAAIQ